MPRMANTMITGLTCTRQCCSHTFLVAADKIMYTAWVHNSSEHACSLHVLLWSFAGYFHIKLLYIDGHT